MYITVRYAYYKVHRCLREYFSKRNYKGKDLYQLYSNWKRPRSIHPDTSKYPYSHAIL